MRRDPALDHLSDEDLEGYLAASCLACAPVLFLIGVIIWGCLSG